MSVNQVSPTLLVQWLRDPKLVSFAQTRRGRTIGPITKLWRLSSSELTGGDMQTTKAPDIGLFIAVADTKVSICRSI